MYRITIAVSILLKWCETTDKGCTTEDSKTPYMLFYVKYCLEVWLPTSSETPVNTRAERIQHHISRSRSMDTQLNWWYLQDVVYCLTNFPPRYFTLQSAFRNPIYHLRINTASLKKYGENQPQFNKCQNNSQNTLMSRDNKIKKTCMFESSCDVNVNVLIGYTWSRAEGNKSLKLCLISSYISKQQWYTWMKVTHMSRGVSLEK